MALRIALYCACLALSATGITAAGEFTVLHCPESLAFMGSRSVSESHLKDIFSASLGLSVEETSEWDGLHISDPFNTPEAVVEVYIDGIPNISDATKLKSKDFPLIVDEYEPDLFESVSHRLKQRFTKGGNRLVNIKLSDPSEVTSYLDVFGHMNIQKNPKYSLGYLKPTVEEDYQFLTELEALKAITAKVQSGVIKADNILDLYQFRFRSLHVLSDFYGANSLETKEAKQLLGKALEALTDAFVKAYDNRVLVTAVASDVAHTRRVRAAPDTTTSTTDSPPIQTDEAYSPDYPAIFNIILWFGVVFVFSLISIVYAIMDMDPGRDSIIYRMTSTRMKKDN